MESVQRIGETFLATMDQRLLTRTDATVQTLSGNQAAERGRCCDYMRQQSAAISVEKGLVVSTFAGPDGVVRTAQVKTENGTLRRPATKLAIIDTSDNC